MYNKVKAISLCGILAVVLFILPNTSRAQEAPADTTAVSESQPVSLLHKTMNRVLPFNKVWDLVNSDVPDSAKNWWGLRGDLEKKGLTFLLVYTGDMAFNTTGGSKKGSTYFGIFEMGISVDTEKLGLWKGGTFYVNGTSSFGRRYLTGELSGDMQGASNIEAPHTTKLFELWFEQKLFDDKLAVLIGIHDLNADFDVIENGGDLLNGSFGIQPTLTGNTSASVYPTAGAAIRIKYSPNEKWDFLVGVFDGDQGDSGGNNRHGLNNTLNNEGGVLTIGEVDYHLNLPMPFAANPLPGTIRLGGWLHSDNFDDVTDLNEFGDPIEHGDNFGVYVNADQTVYKENTDEKDAQGLGIFMQYSQVPQDRNEISMYRGFGLRYTGLIPKRDEDTLSFGMAQAFISDSLRNSSGQEDYERVLEFTYKMQLTPAIVFQPDVQFITNPSADPALKNATVVMLRTQISF